MAHEHFQKLLVFHGIEFDDKFLLGKGWLDNNVTNIKLTTAQ